VVLERGYGMADLEHAVPIASNSKFYLGSTSKEFTAMTVLVLAQQGRLQLDDPLRKYIPTLPSLLRAVTVRHLLEHSSGIRDYVGLWTLSGAGDDTPLNDRQVMDMIERQKSLNFTPGDEFLYSNSGYFLLAQLMRPMMMRPFPDLARLLVFDPLGLNATQFHVDRFGLVAHRAVGHSPVARGRYRLNTQTIEVAGDGGLFTTLTDVFQWLRVLENPEGVYAAAVAQMRTKAKLNSGDLSEYGRGLMLKPYKGVEIVSHVGGFRGYRSEILWIPARKFAVACLCNTSDIDAGRMARLVADIWLGLKDPAGIKVPVKDLERKSGVFLDPASGDVLQISVQGEQLLADYTGFQFQLRAETPLRFRSLNAPIDFEIEFRNAGARDEPRFLRVESEAHKPVRMERVTLNPMPPAKPEQFTGEFHSDEAQSLMRIHMVEGRLQVDQNDQLVGNLEPLVGDRFKLANLNVEFVRGDGGQVTAFRLNTGRLRGLLFTRRAAP